MGRLSAHRLGAMSNNRRRFQAWIAQRRTLLCCVQHDCGSASTNAELQNQSLMPLIPGVDAGNTAVLKYFSWQRWKVSPCR